MNETPLLWTHPQWLQSAQDWMRAELERCAIPILGEIEQPHIRPWSTVLRVLTGVGWVYMKASAPYLGHETWLTVFLADFAPQVTPAILSYNLERHWLLMRDSGTPLRTFIRAEKSERRWWDVLPLYVELQKSLMTRHSELLDAGLMDRRLSRLPGLFSALLADEAAMSLDQPQGLTSVEYRQLRACAPRFEEMCAHLAGFGIHESLHHDDFHDGNVFVQDARIIITDWGESALAHPFFTLVVMLRSLENSLELQPDDPKLVKLRDMYLSLWGEYGSLSELQPVVGLAQQIGLVNRALTWQLVISQLPRSLQADHAAAVPSYLQDFLHSMDQK